MQTSLGIELKEEVAIFTYLKKDLQGIRWTGRKIVPLVLEGQGDLRERERTFVQAIKDFLYQHGTQPQQVVLGLPRRLMILRFLDLPLVPREDLEQMLPYELERHLPFPVREAQFDFQILSKGENGRQKVLLVAIQREKLEQFMDLLELAGLRPDIVDVTCLATCNALIYRKKVLPEEVWALLDLCNHQLEVSILREGALEYSRSIHLSEPSPWIEQVKQEWKVLQHHLSPQGNSQGNFPTVSQIFLSGLGATEESCISLQNDLGLPASIPSLPFRAATVRERNEGNTTQSMFGTLGAQDHLPSFITCLGLSLRGLVPMPFQINLWPSEREKKRAEPPKLWITAGLLALIFSLIVGWLTIQAQKDRQSLELLKKEIASYEPRVLEVEKMQKEVKAYREKIATFREMTQVKDGQLNILKELTQLIPQNVWLTDYLYSQKKENISIGGKADSASSLVSPLEESSLIKNVRFSSSITKLGDKEQFKLELELEGRRFDESNRTGKDVSGGGGGGRGGHSPLPSSRPLAKKPDPTQRGTGAKGAPSG